MTFRKLLSVLLVLVLFVSILPLAVSADTTVTLIDDSFETEDDLEGWISIDVDGDGNDWEWMEGTEGDNGDGQHCHTGTHCLGSASYDNDTGVLYPDNWLISPAVELPDNATSIEVGVWARGQDPSWAAENFCIGLLDMASLDDLTSTAQLINLSDDLTATGTYTQYTADASDYAGHTVFFVFRHYDIYDMFRLNLDDVTVIATLGDAPPAADITLEAKLVVGGVQLDWDDEAGVGSYDIYRQKAGSSEWELVDSASDATYVDTTVDVLTTYQYKVASYLAESNVASVTTSTFLDVLPDDSCHMAVDWAVENGIVNGTSATTFSPKDPCTRGQFALMLYRLAGKPEVDMSTNPFTDLPNNAGIKRAIVWAYNEGIVNGTSATTYSPNANITRAQLTLMLYKMAGKPEVTGQSCPFEDLDGLTANNKKAVIWAYNENIVKGTGATTFSPKANCTRGQLVIMLYRFNKNIVHMVPTGFGRSFDAAALKLADGSAKKAA